MLDKVAEIAAELEAADEIYRSDLPPDIRLGRISARITMALAKCRTIEWRHEQSIRRMSEHRDSEAHEQRIARELADEQRTIERATS